MVQAFGSPRARTAGGRRRVRVRPRGHAAHRCRNHPCSQIPSERQGRQGPLRDVGSWRSRSHPAGGSFTLSPQRPLPVTPSKPVRPVCTIQPLCRPLRSSPPGWWQSHTLFSSQDSPFHGLQVQSSDFRQRTEEKKFQTRGPVISKEWRSCYSHIQVSRVGLVGTCRRC